MSICEINMGHLYSITKPKSIQWYLPLSIPCTSCLSFTLFSCLDHMSISWGGEFHKLGFTRENVLSCTVANHVSDGGRAHREISSGDLRWYCAYPSCKPFKAGTGKLLPSRCRAPTPISLSQHSQWSGLIGGGGGVQHMEYHKFP